MKNKIQNIATKLKILQMNSTQIKADLQMFLFCLQRTDDDPHDLTIAGSHDLQHRVGFVGPQTSPDAFLLSLPLRHLTHA
jgi:hypothetical protein